MQLNKVFKYIHRNSDNDEQSAALKSAISREKKIGEMLFGQPPAKVKREFYCKDEVTWIWRDSWQSEIGETKVREVIYEIRNNNIYKVVDGGFYHLSHTEKRNFKRAVEIYCFRAMNEIYNTNAYSF